MIIVKYLYSVWCEWEVKARKLFVLLFAHICTSRFYLLKFIFILQVEMSCLESSFSLWPTDCVWTAAFFTGNTTGNSLENVINFNVHNPGNNIKRITSGCQPGFIYQPRETLQPSRHTVLRDWKWSNDTIISYPYN